MKFKAKRNIVKGRAFMMDIAALMHKGFVCRLDAFSDVYVVMLPEE